MRLWSAEHGSYADRARSLTRQLPSAAAAVPLYVRGRTTLLALDFDVKHGGTEGVERDVLRAMAWIAECGGRAVVDISTRGGRHVLVPLPIGVAVRKTQIEPLLRLLAARLPTLDITPMCNDRTGSITPPGSRCREGGFRQLEGCLDAAVDAFLTRSEAGFIGRLVALMGGTHVARDVDLASRATTVADSSITSSAALWEGTGDDARLHPDFRLASDFPRITVAFARDGKMPDDHRWHARDAKAGSGEKGRADRSAARQSVLIAAALRGLSFADVVSRLPAAGGNWKGFAAAYMRYGAHAEAAMRRDWVSACRWTSQNAPEFRASAHKIQRHTAGGSQLVRPKSVSRHLRRWLAAGTKWVDAQWAGSAHRWTVLAVLQALAYAAALSGEVVNGVPVIEWGGRSLSLMAGLMPETTMWQVLREVRDIPGAPVLHTRPAAGNLADRYALTMPRQDGSAIEPDSVELGRVQVAPVHAAWCVLGLRSRRVHDLIVHGGMTRPTDVFAAARMGRSAGHDALATLTTAGLVTRTYGHVAPGPATLDDIATAHDLDGARAQRIADHKRQRATWRAWLAARYAAHHVVDDGVHSQSAAVGEPWDRLDTHYYLAAVLATGPPDSLLLLTD